MSVSLRELIRLLRPVDLLAISSGVVMSVVIFLYRHSIPFWTSALALNAGISIAIVAVALLAHRTGWRMLQLAWDFYPVPLILLSFKEVHVFVQSVSHRDYDDILIAIDRWMFGGDPTVWMSRFSVPLLTEILQIAYASFYFIMLALGIELYVRGEIPKFSHAIFLILYGFFLSYVGYMLVPGVGPRFTLHDFHTLDAEIPGLFLTNVIREFTNVVESIPKGAENAMALAQRDAFPSGHTQMTLITMVLAQRYRLSARYVIHLLGALLIIGTVYLRYHYVVDLIAGAMFMIFTLWTGRRLFDLFEKVRRI